MGFSLRRLHLEPRAFHQFAVVSGNVYPRRYAAFISIISVVNVDFGHFFSFGCIMSLTFYRRLVLATIGPLVVLLILGCAYARRKLQNNICGNALRVVRDRLVSAATFVMIFAYASATFTILQTFPCDLLDDGNAYLRADYSVSCSTTVYKVYRAYASIMVGVYTIAIPGFFSWWLLRNRKVLQSENRRSIPHLQPFGNLWMAYTPSRYYYEVVECGRRIFYAGSAVLGSVDHRVQSIVVLLNTVVPLVLDALHPFEDAVDVALYRWGNAIILGSIFVALLPSTEDSMQNNTHVISVLSDALLFANLVMAVTVLVNGVHHVVKSIRKVNVTIVDLPVRNHPSNNVRDENQQARTI